MSAGAGDPALADRALALLDAWAPSDGAQEGLRTRYAAHVRAHGAAALAKRGGPDHLTASALVLDPGGEHVLLVHHRKAGAWLQPGGHVDATDADLAAAALREVAEETGLGAQDGVELALGGAPADLDHHDLGAAFGACRSHLDVAFLVLAPRAAAPVLSEESLAVAWWPLAEAAAPGAHLDGVPVMADLPPRLRRAATLLR